jgi:ubiquinone/menaquinone biosynthesis C-methylase UbiE
VIGVDVVLCSRLLMMVACRNGVVSEAFRILRPGGTFLLTEPVPSLRADFAIAALRLVDRCTTLLRNDPSPL